MLFCAETEARAWAISGKKAANCPTPTALPAQAGRVRMRKPPPSGTRLAAVPADSLADAVEHHADRGSGPTRPGFGRCHTVLDRHPSISRVDNAPGRNT